MPILSKLKENLAVALEPTKKVRVKVIQKPDDRRIPVDVLFTVGTLAVHQCLPPYGDTYAITHIPTGLMVCRQATREQAIAWATQVWKKHCLAFREQEVTQVRMKLPRWFESWTLACVKKLDWVDTDTYQEEGRRLTQ